MSIAVHVSCPRTFAQEVLAVELLIRGSHLSEEAQRYHELCQYFAYIVRSHSYGSNARVGRHDNRQLAGVESISIDSIDLNRDGYAVDGTYYGVGLPVYSLDIDGLQYVVRASHIVDVLEACERIFPNAAIGF